MDTEVEESLTACIEPSRLALRLAKMSPFWRKDSGDWRIESWH